MHSIPPVLGRALVRRVGAVGCHGMLPGACATGECHGSAVTWWGQVVMVYLWGRVVIVFLRIPLAMPLPAPSSPSPVERGDTSPYESKWGGGRGRERFY
jgi:hypothetical protein